ncbi:hypothetical protein GCM10009122_40160 [Fulvivirga kasyanovii]|uniref:Nitroreductase n=1 Tax=Fulvivirga kasyanovii TaxID=396812 RepID=A0ABW9RJJ8_9BACT|nr:nitroreductase family protein [Fulvivirga kasyanovii]MTI24106.1 nitroreductase [Fulvivirga kasyanovii]
MSTEPINIKSAQTEFDLHPLITGRWSPRAFSAKEPSRHQILKLLEAARWAPSSFNEQPWRFIVGVKSRGEEYQKILECINDFNKEWADQAPVLMLVCAKKAFTHNDKPNRHYKYDCGAAMSTLSLQAMADNLYVHQMAGINPDKAIELFKVPETFEVLTGVAIGYLGAPDQLSEKNQKAETARRQRKELSQLAFSESWGNSFS